MRRGWAAGSCTPSRGSASPASATRWPTAPRRWSPASSSETSLPLALGFGISHPDHVRAVGQWADAAVVGSGLVQVIADCGDSPSLVPRVEGYVRWLTGRGAGVTIDQLRQTIDELDERLVELLNERASCALRIGEIKQTLGPRDLPAGSRVAGAGARPGARRGHQGAARARTR